MSSRNLGGICSSRAKSAIRIGSSPWRSARARRALMAYLARLVSMRLHVSVASEDFQPTAAGLVLRPPRPLGDVHELPRLELEDDVVHVARVRFDGLGARPAPQRAIPLAVALVVVERDCGNVLPLDVLPDVEL